MGSRDCTHFLKIRFVVAGGRLYSYYIHQGIKSDNFSRKGLLKKILISHLPFFICFISKILAHCKIFLLLLKKFWNFHIKFFYFVQVEFGHDDMKLNITGLAKGLNTITNKVSTLYTSDFFLLIVRSLILFRRTTVFLQ